MSNMSKKVIPVIMLFLLVLPFVNAAEKKTVTVSYNLKKINKMGSNQLAIWIEDSSGKIVRNLFVTKFTAKGGYKDRPQALSNWVEKSDWKNASQKEIDALSSATQKPGNQSITWDCLDAKGNAVADGKYYIMFEGNIYMEKRELAKCEIDVGNKDSNSKGIISYDPQDAKKEGILFDNVSVVFKSAK
jgi:hypothetical protein